MKGIMNTKKVEVVAGIIIYKAEILCVQRGISKFDYVSYKYEFPGGKIEEGESRIEALRREVNEELDMKLSVEEEDYFITVDYHYPDFDIIMHGYICKVVNKIFVLKEHVDYKWMTKDKLLSLDWAPADIPIVSKVMESGDLI